MKYLSMAFAILLTSAIAFGQDEEIELKVEADPILVAPGETFALTITVSASGMQSAPVPVVPRLKNFEIVGRSEGNEVSIVNLSMTVTKKIIYQILVPKDSKDGNYRIPVISVKHNDKTYRAGPVDIIVNKNAPKRSISGRAKPQRNPMLGGLDPDFFPGRNRKVDEDDLVVTLFADKEEVVPYEVLTVKFSFLRAIDLWEQPNYHRPDFEGFWVEDIPYKRKMMERRFAQRMGGKRYRGSEIKYALIPLSTGPRTIESARLMVSPDPWSGRVTLETEPVIINVVDFPKEGKPKSFNGMVGSYSVSSELLPSTIRVNDGATLKLIIHGEGYLKPAPAPSKPEIDGFEVFDPKVTDSLEKEGGKLISTRVVEIPLIARQEGILKIPPIELAWYDPSQNVYVTKKIEPMPVNVAPALFGSANKQDEPDSMVATGDVRFIKADKDELVDWSAPVYSQWWFWVLLIAPIPIVGVAFYRRSRLIRLETDSAYARKVAAYKNVKDLLSKARSVPSRDSLRLVDEAMRNYLADIWNVPTPSIYNEMIESKIGVVNETLSTDIVLLLDEIELLRYSSSDTTYNPELIDKVESLIGSIENLYKTNSSLSKGSLISLTLAIATFSIFSLALSAYAQEEAFITHYNKGNQNYREGRYLDALREYNQIETKNPALEYNRAVAYYRHGDMGRSILHLHRALKYDPSDGDTKATLLVVENALQDKKPQFERSSFETIFTYLKEIMTIDEMVILFLALYLTLTITYSIKVSSLRSNSFLNSFIILVALLFLSWGSLTGWRVWGFEEDNRAVAIAGNVKALTEPTNNSKSVFTFHAGTVVKTGRIDGNYVMVTLPTGITGWVERPDIVTVSPPN